MQLTYAFNDLMITLHKTIWPYSQKVHLGGLSLLNCNLFCAYDFIDVIIFYRDGHVTIINLCYCSNKNSTALHHNLENQV